MFVKGQSGNPGGRPRLTEVQKLAQTHTVEAIAVLVAAMAHPKTCVSAAVALLDRGWGRPSQEISGPDGTPLTQTYVIRAPSAVESAAEWLRMHAPSDSRNKRLLTDT